MSKYSGRTTAFEHKRDDWAKYKGPFQPAVVTETVFNVQWSECPVEVEEEVKRLWQWDEELKNGSYRHWDRDDEYWDERHEEDSNMTMKDAFPLIDEFLMSKGVSQCKINWWW